MAGVGTTGESGRAGYLAVIDGMSVDDPPEEGFVRGPTFLHPTMRIAFSALRDFMLYNDHDGVLGVGSDRSLLYFTCKAGSVPGRLDDWMRNKLAADADRHPVDRDRRRGGRDRRPAARLRHRPQPGALRHHPAARRHLLSSTC